MPKKWNRAIFHNQLCKKCEEGCSLVKVVHCRALKTEKIKEKDYPVTVKIELCSGCEDCNGACKIVEAIITFEEM